MNVSKYCEREIAKLDKRIDSLVKRDKKGDYDAHSYLLHALLDHRLRLRGIKEIAEMTPEEKIPITRSSYARPFRSSQYP